MQSTRLLSLQFLCPSWTTRELARLAQRRRYSKTATPRTRRWNEDSVPDHKQHDTFLQNAQPPRKKDARLPTPTLFDELFPDPTQATRRRSARRTVGRLPAFQWRPGSRPHEQREWVGSSSAALDPVYVTALRNDSAFKVAEDLLREPAVLLVSALSKTLEESDFLRLSPKGDHIEGWSSGLVKVIQARDTATLAPLSLYFLLFSSPQAANDYQENLRRLHDLSRTSSYLRQSSLPLPPTIKLKEGETVDALLRSFTISSPAHSISARFLKTPFTPFVQDMVQRGSHAAVKDRQGKGDALVLLWADMGRYSEMDIFDAIVKSGRERNLAWKLAGGQRDIEKLNTGSGSSVLREDDDMDGLDEGRGRRSSVGLRESRFVLSFRDRHEARRFVREWHRRPLPGVSKAHPPNMSAQIMW